MIKEDCYLSKTNFDFLGKTVLVRIDCDVDLRNEDGNLVVDEDFRLRQVIPTIKFLQEKGAGKIVLLGHLGRPDGAVKQEMVLESVGKRLNSLLQTNFKFLILNFKSIFKDSISNFKNIYQIDEKVLLLENLRFNKGEEENDEKFAKELAGLGDVYINDAFGVSHREHASIVRIPKVLPSFLGLNFENEIINLSKLSENPVRPLIFVLGGSKKDKLGYLEFLGKWCDKVLVGGKLPLSFRASQTESDESRNPFLCDEGKGSLHFSRDDNVIIAKLSKDGKDIDEGSIQKFKDLIKTAKTIVWAGPMGVYEEKENQKGTFEIAKAVAESNAYKVAGGGDTHRVLSWLNLWDKFDFVSSGGGAMLAFLKNRTLPGIEAINH